MKNTFFAFLFLIISSSLFGQTNWYVSQQSGADTNNGTSSSTPFKTIDKVVSVVNDGDTVFLMGEFTNDTYDNNFTYTNEHDAQLWHQENTISINGLNGDANNYITFRSYDSSTIIKGDGANIIRVQNSSYLKFDGLNIQGEVDNILLSTALALQFVYIDADNVANQYDPTAAEIIQRDEDDCVSNCQPGVTETEVYSNIQNMNVSRPSYTDTRGMYLSDVHHIDILNNHIQKMPGGGLRVSKCEDINIIGNEIDNCARKSYSGTHALVVTKAKSTRTTNDYRINILKNKVHYNYNEIFSWSPSKTKITPHIDEGKGISLQRNETDTGNGINWDNGRILVANNICYYNGFSGIHSNDGNRIDFINNTCYFNSYTKSIYAPTTGNGGNIGISCQGGSDIKILNNISIIDSDLNKSAIASNITGANGLVVKNNIIYGTNGVIGEDPEVVAVQVNTQMVDPMFTNATSFNFTLQSSSPAINFVGVTNAPIDDFDGQLRDANPDLGAMEFMSPLPVELIQFDGELIENRVRLNWSTASEQNVAGFEIQKSNNATDWERLGFVVANNHPGNYQTWDENPFIGITYYRLKNIDLDDSYEFSDIIAVHREEIAEVLVFPNPASESINVSIKRNTNTDLKVEVIDVLGRTVFSQNDFSTFEKNHSMNIELHHLPTGRYWLSIQDGIQVKTIPFILKNN